MSGHRSAGRNRTSLGRGGSNSTSKGNYGNNVSRDDTTDDEHINQYDGLDNLKQTNAREIGSPSSQA